ncbi:hypothetical protein [Paenibacillus jiagnxiensis]|uniref:hypothetical protein n=1 Tax=Paenibacillus jiagnxiensis TaxID=3228926 RepID=UPI00339FF7BF
MKSMKQPLEGERGFGGGNVLFGQRKISIKKNERAVLDMNERVVELLNFSLHAPFNKKLN